MRLGARLLLPAAGLGLGIVATEGMAQAASSAAVSVRDAASGAAASALPSDASAAPDARVAAQDHAHTPAARRTGPAALAAPPGRTAAPAFHPRLPWDGREAALALPEARLLLDRFWAAGPPVGRMIGVGGVPLAWRVFLQPDRAAERGAVLIVSGRTETMAKYQETVWDLYQAGWSVYLYDHRGQGLSGREPAVDREGRRQHGHVERFDDYVDDLRELVRTRLLPAGHRELRLLAHSMGGAISARLLQQDTPEAAAFGAVALLSPMMAIRGLGDATADGLLCGVARSADALGLGARYIPGGGDWRERDFDGNRLTGSALRLERLHAVYRAQPEARLGSATFGWTVQACAGARAAREQAARIRQPLLLAIGEGDRIVHPQGAQAFCAAWRAADPQVRRCGGADGGPWLLPDARHELLIERDALRTPVLQAVLRFFERPQLALPAQELPTQELPTQELPAHPRPAP
ncbi:MAG: hypothetical protein RL223_3395 [Pseudomonadota bacterium]|jgi:lysophospholipase